MFDLPDVGPGVLFGAVTMVAWGFWLVLGDAASESIDPRTAAAISYLVAAAIAVGYVVVSDASLAVTSQGVLFAVAAGVFSAIGLIATYVGLSVAPAATVSTVGAMYFVVAALAGMAFLGDGVTVQKVAGIALAATGVFLVVR